ncbi:MAG TPA: response regulator, partial [Elusimicrobiales bacterium]|nr:response regulator [Elusimicrobiales bacterium]
MSLKKRILLVDDDPMLRQLAEDVLSDDYEVLQAVDGQDAWEKAPGFRPDLVVTDIMMPRMHGYELCQLLKGPEGIKGVRILVASAKSFATDKSQAEKAGADAYLVKPYKPADLLEKVSALLSGEIPAAGPAAVPPPPPPPQGISAPPPPPPPTVRAPQGPVSMRVRFWGTRGSCPVPGPNTVRYGGNTSCIEVRIGDLVLILDCGTGVRELGKVLMREFKDRPIEGHIFVGHTHWDHIQGFPFFAPLYNPRNTFNIYSVRAAHGSLQNVFGGS